MLQDFKSQQEREEFHRKARVVSSLLAPLFFIFIILIIDIFVSVPIIIYPIVYGVTAAIAWVKGGEIGKREVAIHNEGEDNG